ncbi:MAG: tRNA dihydrouridine(20/20a) synthase DusA [Rhodobacteraceae bacterium]|nr:tRNA dihydrouridine(20/20a) synthase DusA [Paracoccaceae bacterium]
MTNSYKASRLSVAPMMDWTDRHCRYFHRLLSRETLLYTEMVTAKAVIHGHRERLLGFHPAEHPVALQLGGSVPAELAEATRIAAEFGYDEVNLNVGCPSDRVQSGSFGAVLMEQPELVADCVVAMQGFGPEITVKCRIGVDEQEPRDVLPDFLKKVAAAGVQSFTVHARKAWLQGLSPKQNRDVPPLDYPLVYAMKAAFPALEICINGGIATLDEAEAHLKHVDGVMVGRAAYHDPFGILAEADARVFNGPPARDEAEVINLMCEYIETELAKGARLNQITRHILGAFAGRPGARRWRRVLSEGAHLDGAGPALIMQAYEAVKG